MLDVIKKVLELLKAIAASTPNVVDDAIIKILEQILGNETLLQIVIDLIQGWFADPQLVRAATFESLTAEQQEAILAAKIDWKNLMTVIMKIIEMLGLFMKDQK